MKQILTFILLTLLYLPLQAQEKVYTVDNIPKVHLQNKFQYVCNPAGILSQAACDSIDRMLYNLEETTGIETVVAVVPSIGSEDCFEFAHQLLNKWGVGKKGKNNGLVILLVTDQRCIQFYTGYGRRFARRNLQTNTNEINDSLSESRKLERRNGKWFTRCVSTS